MKRAKKIVQTLHLGCGMEKTPSSIGVDINPDSTADVIHDLNVFPYPFPANRFTTVVADNILEHLDNLVKVMEEIYRITKPGAKIYIKTAHFTSVDSFTDPTHKHFFTSRTFDYFIPGTDLYKYHYSQAKFKKVRVVLGPTTENLFLKTVLAFINRFAKFYESRFAYIFPVGVISYELETLKSKTH